MSEVCGMGKKNEPLKWWGIVSAILLIISPFGIYWFGRFINDTLNVPHSWYSDFFIGLASLIALCDLLMAPLIVFCISLVALIIVLSGFITLLNWLNNHKSTDREGY